MGLKWVLRPGTAGHRDSMQTPYTVDVHCHDCNWACRISLLFVDSELLLGNPQIAYFARYKLNSVDAQMV